MITNLKFRTFLIILVNKVNIYMLEFTSKGFILMVLLYTLLYLLTMSSNLSIYKFFDIEVIYL